MLAHELGYATVEYYDDMLHKENEVVIYFRYLPRRGDLITIYTSDDREIRKRVSGIEHFVEDQRRIEPDIIIRTECP